MDEPAPLSEAKTPAIDRAAINRANARKSTGPKTPEGKRRSAQNACKRGLYSSCVVHEGEDLAEYEAFRGKLIAEFEPASPAELFLVDELAQNGWRIRRFRSLHDIALTPEFIDEVADRTLNAYHRALATAERSFHRSLAALTKLQRERGFVSKKDDEANTAASREPAAPEKAVNPVAKSALPSAAGGFVPQTAPTRPVNHESPAPVPSSTAAHPHEKTAKSLNSAEPHADEYCEYPTQ